jgi:uncharacterized protein YjbI with pentapeptide repeats
MNNPENPSISQEAENGRFVKLTRDEVIGRLESKIPLENLVLADLDLAGLNLDNVSLRGSDIRGLNLYRQEQQQDGSTLEVKTSIKGADLTDTLIADLGPEVYFKKADAEGATFGFSKNLLERRKQQIESGRKPKAEETGGLFNFNGTDGNFKRTKWLNADFGGGSGYDAIFPRADLSEATLEGCDLSGTDFSDSNIENIKIISPLSLSGMKIRAEQLDSVASAIEFSGSQDREAFDAEKDSKGARKALEEYFGLTIVG